jgi:uncharacterized protein (TIGR02453 family)
MSFSGWPEEALDFYDGLAADNSKTYWTANKQVYEAAVLRPMTELVEELAPEFGEAKIFRPYRDIRFSKDKTPYKTHIGALVGRGYVQFSAQGLAAGNGMYGMAPDQLDRYRQAVVSDRTGAELEDAIAAIEKEGIGVSGRDVLKSAPRGYPADHPRIGLLRYKGIVAWKEWPVETWLETAAARDRVAGFLRATRPLIIWLADNVGSSATEGVAR